MNRNEFIKTFAKENSLELDVAKKIVNIFFNSIKRHLMEEGRVEIRGFGSFRVKNHGGYMGRNPKTGIAVEVRPKRMPSFRAGRDFMRFLNKGNKADEINQ